MNKEPHEPFLYLYGELTDEQTREVSQRLLEGWNREFLLIINSDGGSTFNALSLVNLIKAHGRVDTLCTGVAMSGGADCLAAGRRRYIVPNAIGMIHQVSWDLGQEFAANLVENARFLERLNRRFTEMLAEDTGKSVEELSRDMVTDHYLFGQEIIDYGLADELFDPQIMRRYESRRPSRWLPEGMEPRRLTSPPPQSAFRRSGLRAFRRSRPGA